MSATLRSILCGSIVMAVGAVALLAHLAVVKTMPEAEATVTESPSAVQVWYTQSPELAVSALSLAGPAGEVELGETKSGDENSLVAEVSGTLTPGAYTVSWRTAGDDGHVLRGEFGFAVAEADDLNR